MKKAAEILARLLQKGPAGAGGSPFHSLFGGWQDMAGPSLAEHCQPYEVRHHALLVEADHPGWLQLLLMQKKAILARIRQRFPQLELRDIRVHVRVGASPAPRQRPAAAPGKPDTSAGRPAAAAKAEMQHPEAAGKPAPAAPPSAAARQALEAVDDPELREKLRLLLQELERRIDTSDDK